LSVSGAESANELLMKLLARHPIPFAIALSLIAPSAASAATYSTRSAVKLLRAVVPNETLTDFKRHLPPKAVYKWQGTTSLGDWTWNVVRFNAEKNGVSHSGVAIFANDRAKYARLRPAANDAERRKIQITATEWRAGDKLHSVHMFLGDERKSFNVDAIDRETKRQMDAISRTLGKPKSKEHETYGQGPEDAGWTATWKLSGNREIYFAETLALLDSEVRPSVQLTFSYSQIYRA